MGLLRFQKFSKTPTFIQRFFKQKEEKQQFFPDEKEFSAKTRNQFLAWDSATFTGVRTTLTIPSDSYGFITNLTVSTSSSTVAVGDVAVHIGMTTTPAKTVIRMLPPVDSTGGKFAISNHVFNMPLKLKPGESVFLENLQSQRSTINVFGFLIDRKDVDRVIVEKYG